MTRIRSDTLYGTLNLLILRAVADGARHGLEIRHRIRAMSGNALKVEDGAIYPALRRLDGAGLLTSEWRISDKGRRARYYALTAKGRQRLERETQRWLGHVAAVGRVLGQNMEPR